MEIRREILVGMATLLLFNMLLAFGSIGLLGRMGPAIARIVEENVAAMQAGQAILLVMADSGGRPASTAERQRFADAMREAIASTSMPEEKPILAALQKSSSAALAGDPAARTVVLSRATRLVGLNLAAMQQADARAQRLGAAGAWISVFVTVLSFALGISVLRRLDARIVVPLQDLNTVVEAASRGDRFRRCRPFSGPRELGQTLNTINELLDERLNHDLRRSARPPGA
jgi:methyl-accepting chemotaxis protein